MVQINETFTPIDEELDIAKEARGDSFGIRIEGTPDEMWFLSKNFILPNKNRYGKFWFNQLYNKEAFVSEGGKKFFAPPLTTRKGPDGNWSHYFIRTKTPEFVEPQLRAIQLFIRDVNMAMAKEKDPENLDIAKTTNPKLEEFLTKLEQVRDYIEATILPTVETPSALENIKDKLDDFINELADAVDDTELLEKVTSYLAFASIFKYSFINTFLIYLQNKSARQILSKGNWAKINRQPKSAEYLNAKYPGTGAIGIWAPKTVSGGIGLQANAEDQWRKKNGKSKLPDNPSWKDLWYNKAVGKTGLTLGEKLTLDIFVKRHSSETKGYTQFKMVFAMYDVEDVEQMAEKPVAELPETPKWHSSEPDEKADHIYELVVSVIKDLGLNFQEKEDMGGSKGSSSQGGDINLLASNSGVGRTSTATHELAHALTHQRFLYDSNDVDSKMPAIDKKIAENKPLNKDEKLIVTLRVSYHGRDETKVLELQAEGIAFVVLRYFGIPQEKLKHSSAYITLWRNDKAAVLANLTILSDVAKHIIMLMKDKIIKDNESDEVPEELEEDLSFLHEMEMLSLSTIIDNVRDLKTLIF